MTSIPTLVHIDPARGPVGVWRVVDGELHHHYRYKNITYARRALEALNARGNDVPWDAWFERLADRTPYFDDYLVVPSDPAVPLDVVFAWVTQLWHNVP